MNEKKAKSIRKILKNAMQVPGVKRQGFIDKKTMNAVEPSFFPTMQAPTFEGKSEWKNKPPHSTRSLGTYAYLNTGTLINDPASVRGIYRKLKSKI